MAAPRFSRIGEFALALAFLAAATPLLLIGLSIEQVLLFALAAYLARHLFHLVRLTILVRQRHRLVPPFPLGLWAEVYRAIAQYQQRGRKRRKRQLRFVRRFREAANAVPDALLILDRGHRIEWANPAAAQLMDIHWPRDEGRSFAQVIQRPELAEILDEGEYSRPIEIAPAHNRALMLTLRVAPFGERKRQRLVVARDITKIFHLNMIRRDFVANASHELRTPLTVISGFLENLDNAQTPAAYARPFDLMRRQSERMRLIIDDLLTLSRLEMDAHSLELGPVDVPEELRLIVGEAQALNEWDHQVTLDIDDDLLMVGNSAELRSAFSNLVFNAVKHTAAGTRIRIRWGEDPRGLACAVEDTGPGIAREHIPRLTERFYRVDKGRSRASGGTGLGLAIVHHVLNRHDGRLLIASESGQGSTFTCRFPANAGLSRESLRLPGDEAAAR